MNKKEFIEKLREHGAWCTECHDINGEKDRYVKFAKVRELIEQMEEPKQVKPVVKPFVADWFEENKQALEGNIFTITIDIYDKGAQTEFEKWFNANDTKAVETLIKMKLFGYTVEQPKRWVVRAGDYHSTYVDSLTITSEKSHHTISGKEKAHYFTDLKKAEAVATLVDGSVEEI